MKNNTEQMRMATLLKSPEAFQAIAGFTNDSSWQLSGNQWIWNKFTEHYALHKTPPTISILMDYAENDKSGMDSVSIVAAKELLKSYESQTPLDHSYFMDSMLTEGRDRQIKDMILAPAQKGDWQQVSDIIKVALQSASKLPEKLNLQTLMTKPSNDEQNLLNEWAFERQAILAIVAPTGFGKSVMTMQLSTHFACGKSVVGFNPQRAFKVLVIQNEDSDNDIALMRDGSMSQLNDKERAMVYENLFFVRLRGKHGKSFLSALEMYCQQFKPDMIFVNPLLKYYGGDPLNTKDVSNFLNELEPILERYNCGMVLVHHTIKQSKQSRMNQVDSSYAGFGSSAWSNSVRDTIEIRQSKLDGFYKLITGKRSTKWGWKERYIKRSDDFLLPYWKDASDIDINELSNMDKSNVTSNENRELILEKIRPLPITMTIQELKQVSDMSENTIRNHVRDLFDENKIAVAVNEDKADRCKRYYLVTNQN